MAIELWFAFFVASALLLIIPGPTVLLVASLALRGGRKTAKFTVPGVVLGDFVAMSVSLAGAGAILAASATLFTVMKLAGAAYLFWLGYKLWRAEPQLTETGNPSHTATGWNMFLNCFVVTALNPKGIIFFVAFVPQFVDVTQPVLPQFLVLQATFLALAAFNVAVWAILAGQLRQHVRRPSVLKTINRLGGSLLIAAGMMTATMRRVN
ncbi:MAG: LysE family translocator [Stappiaceae bacterium]